MSGLILMWLGRRLRYPCLAVIVVAALASCASSGSHGGPGTPQSSAFGTDTASVQLGFEGLGACLCTKTPEPSLPVQVSGDDSNYAPGSTASFRVDATTVIVQYSYDCSSANSKGFAVDMISTSDDQKIAQASALSGSATVTIHPKNVPGDYSLSIITLCKFAIAVRAG